MKLLTLYDFQQALQEPDQNFGDPSLRTAKVLCDAADVPVMSENNSAVVFCVVDSEGTQWLLQCFKSFDPGCLQQYSNIKAYLQKHDLPFFVPLEYQTFGLFVQNRWYPLVKEKLVPGDTLDEYIDKNVFDSDHLSSLSARFLGIIQKLERLQIAHGNLCHEYVIVAGDEIFLSGYDCMYLPAPQGTDWLASGHQDYQHPYQTPQFNNELDRFASIVIYISLQALCFRPDLWSKYHNSENLLLTQRDYLEPDTSPLLREMESIPTLRHIVQQFRLLCRSQSVSIPTLSSMLASDTTSWHFQTNPRIAGDAARQAQPVRSRPWSRGKRITDLLASLAENASKRKPSPAAGKTSPKNRSLLHSTGRVPESAKQVQKFVDDPSIRTSLREPALAKQDISIRHAAYNTYLSYSNYILDLIEECADEIPPDVQASALELMKVIDDSVRSGKIQVEPAPVIVRRPSRAIPPVHHYDVGAYASGGTI